MNNEFLKKMRTSDEAIEKMAFDSLEPYGDYGRIHYFELGYRKAERKYLEIIEELLNNDTAVQASVASKAQ